MCHTSVVDLCRFAASRALSMQLAISATIVGADARHLRERTLLPSTARLNGNSFPLARTSLKLGLQGELHQGSGPPRGCRAALDQLAR